MERPLKIYLDEQIQQDGLKIGHTPEGLKYLVAHHRQILAIATRGQLADPVRQHIEELIGTYQQHIQWYEKQQHALPKRAEDEPGGN